MMKKVIKKIVTGMLVLVMMLVSLPINAFAAQSNSDEIISFEDYYSAMKAEYAKYGHTYEVLQKNDDFVFTKKVLQEQIKLVDKGFKEAEKNSVIDAQLIDSTDNNIVNADTVNAESATSFASTSLLIPTTKYSYACISDPYYYKAQANFRFEAHLTENVIAGYIYSFDSCSFYQYGVFTFLKDWSLNSLTYSLSNGVAHATASVRITFQYEEPKTGILIGDTFYQTINFAYAP
jgi:hypothetical protein